MCKLLIPDSGPLITFGMADRLDLLNAYGMSIYVPDAVFYEVTFDNTFKEVPLIEQFITDHAFTIPTYSGMNLYRAGKNTINTGTKLSSMIRQAGDTAITETLTKLANGKTPFDEGKILVLFEDKDIITSVYAQAPTFPLHIRFMTTASYILNLENDNHIVSAQELRNHIAQSGRRLSTKPEFFDKEVDFRHIT